METGVFRFGLRRVVQYNGHAEGNVATARKEDQGYEHDETIRETPGVSGGYPCIGHTRIPVRLIVEAYRDTGSIDRVHAFYGQLTRGQVEAALAYYREHPERVDEDIERNARTWAELTSREWRR